jgi:hypothetical protein
MLLSSGSDDNFKYFYYKVVTSVGDVRMDKIIGYDRKGFVPSEGIKTLEEYVQESKQKESFLSELRDNLDQVLYEKLGEEFNAKLYEPPKWVRERFEEITATEIWPGIITTELGAITIKAYKKGIIKWSFLFPLLFFKLLTPAGKSICLREKINVPTIERYAFDASKKELYIHELTHAMRDQFTKKIFDEISAFKFQDKINNTHTFSSIEWGLEYGFGYSVLGYNTPLLVASVLFNPLLLCAPFGIVPVTACYFYKEAKKFDKFIDRCEQEGLNPWYLLLRSDVHEYKLDERISEQLEKKEGLRFEIMRMRIEDDF